MASKEEYLEKMAKMVVEMEDEEIGDLCREYLKEGYDPEDAIFNGLIKGMNEVGKLFEEEEYFISDLLICSDAMYNGIDVLKKKLKATEKIILPQLLLELLKAILMILGKIL